MAPLRLVFAFPEGQGGILAIFRNDAAELRDLGLLACFGGLQIVDGDDHPGSPALGLRQQRIELRLPLRPPGSGRAVPELKDVALCERVQAARSHTSQNGAAGVADREGGGIIHKEAAVGAEPDLLDAVGGDRRA